MSTAYIGLGSNLEEPRRQVQAALAQLAALPESCLDGVSGCYRTPPWGGVEQPWFVNAVARLRTMLTPQDLWAALAAIEQAAGRRRAGPRWGPRVLDLDLLHIEGVILDTADLRLPHPRIRERAFVLLPLNELAPTLDLPGQGRVQQLLAQLDVSDCLPLTGTIS